VNGGEVIDMHEPLPTVTKGTAKTPRTCQQKQAKQLISLKQIEKKKIDCESARETP